MQKTPSTIVAGLYLTQLMLQIQLDEAKSDMYSAELEEFTRSIEDGELSENGRQIFYSVLSKTMEQLVTQFGLLQATKLTRGLFQPAVFRVTIEHLLNHADVVDWSEVAQEISRVAEKFKLAKLINSGSSRPLGPQHADQIRLRMKEFLRLLNLALLSDVYPSGADYRYILIWSKFFPNSRGLCDSLNKVGVTPRDDGDSSTATANLLGTESGEFEAFCVLCSLGPESAELWEKERVEYGEKAYAGAIERAKYYLSSTERDSIFASAFAAGYPVQDPEVETNVFSDLIIQIPGCVSQSEQRLVTDLVSTVALVLYQSLTQEHYRKPQRWRGLSLSTDYEQTRVMLDDMIGASAWLPAVKLRVQAFTNQHFHSANNESSTHDDLLTMARKLTTQHASALRVIYLIDQLCEIIEDDFYAHDFLK